MAPRYIQRSLEAVLEKAASEFPAVILTGPRQSGKTTLLRHQFGKRCRYASLELPDVRAAAVTDPRSFMERHPPPAIFDEVQNAPELLHYIKERIDENRHKKGQYLLTGSQNLMLAKRVTESLAGRAALFRLLPLSNRESAGSPQAPLAWESGDRPTSAASSSFGSLWTNLLRGGYPELAADPERDAGWWHASYIQTYLERDVRSLRQIGDLIQYQNFLQSLARRSARPLNLLDVSRDLGVAVNTVKAWLSLLEATYQVIVVRPYFANVGKRLGKTPKVYFTDVGTLCYLAGLQGSGRAALGPMDGAVFETAVLSEVIRTLTHRGKVPRVYFWRTAAGTEVDFVVDVGDGLVPIEVTPSATPSPSMASRIKAFQRDLGEMAKPGYVVHPGVMRLPLGSGVSAIPFSDL